MPDVERWLLLGQSSGGYAALLASRLLSPSITFAFAPQTFEDSHCKAGVIHHPGNFQLSTTIRAGGIIQDLRSVFFDKPDSSTSKCSIFVAYSEHENPPTSWLWLDAMHWGRLVDHPDVAIFLTAGTSHPVLFGQVQLFPELVSSLQHFDFRDTATLNSTISSTLYYNSDVK